MILFGFLGLNFGWGVVNLILSSKLAEYRIDDISTDGGMGSDWASIGKRFRAANYTAAGQRLLPWLIISTVAQVIALFTWVFLAPL
jgi:hypothetical protein